MGKLLNLRLGLRHERMVAEWCEEAITALSALSGATAMAFSNESLPASDKRESAG